MAGEQYLVIARKWRPQSFEDVVGQEHITRTIQNAITSGRIGHAFLFIGSRGIGKTTTARILAKALNCESTDGPTPHPCGVCDNCRTIAAGNSIDVIEIDGASNNSVEDVRQIRENIRLVPSRCRYKIYVIDEVHQLSSSAFNALLKTLEEPPEHAIFILATTDAGKIPATIVSRCQRYDFRRVPLPGITALLRKILDADGYECAEEALYAIARAADGGIRDSESILEQVISYSGKSITYQDVFDVLGLVDWSVLHEFANALISQDIATLLRLVERVVAAGKDLSQFVQDILQYFRNLLVCKTADPKGLLALPDNEIAVMKEMAAKFTLTGLIRMVEQFAELSKDFDSQLAQRIALESLLIRVSKVSVEMSLDAVLEKLALLGAGGVAVSAASGAAPIARPVSTSEGQSSAHNVGQPPSAAIATGASRPQPRAAAPQTPQDAHEEAPAGPDPHPKRLHITPENMVGVWPRLAHAVGEENLNLGVALGHAKPIAIDGETLILEFDARQTRSLSIAERAGNAAVVASVMRRVTGNITSCRWSAGANGVAEPEERGTLRHVGGLVHPDEARAVMKDPHIAKVLEVFRGQIVDIKHSPNGESL
ncbi:MAG: DNA polymerase III subunit gamma/tau [Candidatus Hydrogenedentales bacterium]